jgi:hypothetical protein
MLQPARNPVPVREGERVVAGGRALVLGGYPMVAAASSLTSSSGTALPSASFYMASPRTVASEISACCSSPSKSVTRARICASRSASCRRVLGLRTA